MQRDFEYIPRITDSIIAKQLSTFGAVAIVGPKWCGKTTSGSQVCRSEISLTDPAGQFQNRRLASIDPSRALEGARPRLVDEWQEVPSLWDAVRFECDKTMGLPGQFVLTGSSIPRPKGQNTSDAEPMHSGAGRIGSTRMSTLTLVEQGISDSTTSLGALMAQGSANYGVSKLSLSDIADIVCRGGWPLAYRFSTSQSMMIARSYIDAITHSDISRIDGVKRDPEKASGLIFSLARNESTLATNKTLLGDMAGVGMADSTLRDYIGALKSIYFIDDIPAWSPALRSPIKVRASAKRHLVDPSLAAAALGASPESLIRDLKTLGLLFESLVLHDLKVYAATIDAEVLHYRDDSGLEADAIVRAPNNSWAAVEIKLGAVQEDSAAASLNALEAKMTSHGERPPLFKAVIVGTGAVGHERKDGVKVIPVDSLGV